MNKYGTQILYNGMTGEEFDTEIFIGPTYYQRLQHLVSEKMYARSTGKLSQDVRQPVGGRSVGGALIW